jgi:dTDP-4-amino-4,6-dideoxygalactose transaminase
MLRDWGQEGKYRHVLKGFNYRMDELQAAFLSVKLPHLDAWNDARRTAARIYDEVLARGPVELPRERPGTHHVYHVYPVRAKDRAVVKKALLDAEIESGIHYPDPVHLTPAFADLGYEKGSFPVAENIAREELSLPMFPGLHFEAIAHVAQTLGCRGGK